MTVFLIILGVLIAADIIFTELLYRYLFCRRQPQIMCRLLDNWGHTGDYYKHRDSTAKALSTLPHERLTIRSERGNGLTGYYFCFGDKPSGKIAFIVHGYHSDAIRGSGMYYEYYKSRGFDLFCCDNTAHGKSEGKLIGYSAYEREDCLRWLEYLQERYGKDIQVVLHGFSLGGATVAAISDRVPACVKFIVDDSGFTSARDILKPRLKVMYQPMRLLNRLAAGYDLDRTDVRGDVANAKVPMLFMHGSADNTVPFALGKELFELCASEKDALHLDEAGHIECMHRAPDEYAAKIDGFISRFVK